ncbi:glycoside hydrolase family 3 C-terminal domain-containing protein, partial [Kitasatospora sp. NPDC093558]|uniref:glycoside hydrolase family 3 C-terminal domain-containing protein n=1 Tax=Kitasatospora sp. NPDC093558 TaxID=3155201 RepID=UPI0034436F38
TLELPGRQADLLAAVLDSGTPVVLTLLAGRPYALGRAVTEAAGIVQCFFPGEAGTRALAGVLSGRVNPSGRLPVSVPGHPGVQPSTYLAAKLAQAGDVSSTDPTPAYGFGHGLGYSEFAWSGLDVQAAETGTDGEFRLAFELRNTGVRAGAEVVQLYLHDPVASVVQPVQRLVGYRRIQLDAGAGCRIELTLPADLASFTGRDGRRTVEPGALELRISASSTDHRLTVPLRLTSPARPLDHTRRLHPTVSVHGLPSTAPSH